MNYELKYKKYKKKYLASKCQFGGTKYKCFKCGKELEFKDVREYKDNLYCDKCEAEEKNLDDIARDFIVIDDVHFKQTKDDDFIDVIPSRESPTEKVIARPILSPEGGLKINNNLTLFQMPVDPCSICKNPFTLNPNNDQDSVKDICAKCKLDQLEEAIKTTIDTPIKSTVTTIIELCCGNTPTQWLNRMWKESKSHNVVSNISGFIKQKTNTLATNSGFSYDGMVLIDKNESFSKKINNINVDFSNDETVFKSDHAPVILSFKKINDIIPNIISFNLEGFSRYNSINEDTQRIEKLTTYIKNQFKPGTLMVCQELALQFPPKKYPGDDAFSRLVEENIDILIEKSLTPATKDKSHNFDIIPDGYTSCIIYDSSFFELLYEIRNPRKNSNKFSNAYVFKIKFNNFIFCVINIHLKAPNPSQLIDNFNFSKGRITNMYELHKSELSNILQNTLKELNGLPDKIKNCPILLCGDFNNTTSKAKLVTQAIKSSKAKY